MIFIHIINIFCQSFHRHHHSIDYCISFPHINDYTYTYVQPKFMHTSDQLNSWIIYDDNIGQHSRSRRGVGCVLYIHYFRFDILINAKKNSRNVQNRYARVNSRKTRHINLLFITCCNNNKNNTLNGVFGETFFAVFITIMRKYYV